MRHSFMPRSVITSYSIHYTKLYDVTEKQPARQPSFDEVRDAVLEAFAQDRGAQVRTADRFESVTSYNFV